LQLVGRNFEFLLRGCPAFGHDMFSEAEEPRQRKAHGAVMSAHFDGGAEIAGRRLREVEVSYVDDPTLDMGAEDSDDCPASPPPTYYLRVREEKRASGGRRDGPNSGGGGGSSGSNNGFGKQVKPGCWMKVKLLEINRKRTLWVLQCSENLKSLSFGRAS